MFADSPWGPSEPRAPRGIRRIIGGQCGFRDSSSSLLTILEEHLNTDYVRWFDSHNYPDFHFDLPCNIVKDETNIADINIRVSQLHGFYELSVPKVFN